MAITERTSLRSKPLGEVRSSVPVELVQRETLKRVSLNLPESQRNRWKIAAIDQKTTLSDLIINAVEASLVK